MPLPNNMPSHPPIKDRDTAVDAVSYALSEGRILTNDLPPAEVERALEALGGNFISTQELFLLGASPRC